jgi:hypothetical protein
LSHNLGHLQLPKIEINSFLHNPSFASRSFIHYSGNVDTTEAGQNILRRLSNEPRVSTMSGQLIPGGLNNSATFDINIMAAWWIMRANEEGIERADSDLEAYLTSDVVDVIVSYWIVGLNPSKVIKLGEGFDLCPLSEMPDSDSKERYSQAINKMNKLDGPIPRAAICKMVKRKKIKDQLGDEISTIDSEISQKTENIIRLLNCIKGVICLPWIQTSHLPASIPTGILGTSDLRWPRSDFSYQKVVNLDELDASLLMNLFNGLKRLDAEWVQRISMALDRLAIAKATKNIHSSSLDLGISLEMILLTGEGAKSQIRQTFSTRASWFIGHDGEERLRLFKEFKSIYDNRSCVAHGGFSDKLQKLQTNEAKVYLDNHFGFAERVFQKIIIDGPPLSWDAIVLDA